MKGTFFITGIDTNIGKSYATGWLAREWNSKGIKTITQKMIQTGNVGHSEDIDLHREIMGIPFTPEDKEQITFPIVYSYPASPHLAAEIDDCMIPIEKITESTRILQQLPVILVTSGRLGSINHTLLSIEALVNRNIPLYGIVYNTFPKTDERIDKDTEEYLKTYLNEHFPQAHFWTLPEIALPR